MISKLVERVVQQQILHFLEQTGQLNSSNHEYRRNLSTTTTLTEIVGKIFQSAEEKNIAQVMQIDQSAAFDTVDHSILVQKLALYGMSTTVQNWVTDYLSYRTQYVCIGRAMSRMQALDRGVPQGSVAGPLFYAIFTNELTETVKNENCHEISHNETTTLFGRQCRKCGILSVYADDTMYVASSKTRAENQLKILRNLDEIKCFLNDNQLTINSKKTSLTEYMVHQKKAKTKGDQPRLQIPLEPGKEKIITDSSYTRILGANLQGNLTWQDHLETGAKALLPETRKQLGRLKHLGKKIPQGARKNLARGLILSKMNYLMPLWGGATNSLIRRAQTVLNSTARWVTGLPRRTKVSKLMEKTGWYTIKEQIKISTALQSWKICHLQKPGRLHQSLKLDVNNKMLPTDPRLLATKRCFQMEGMY